MPYYVFHFDSEEQPTLSLEAPSQEKALEKIKKWYCYKCHNLEGKLIKVEERQRKTYEVEFRYTVTIKLPIRTSKPETVTDNLEYYAWQDPHNFERDFDATRTVSPMEVLSVSEVENSENDYAWIEDDEDWDDDELDEDDEEDS